MDTKAPIIDSAMTFEQALWGSLAPREVLSHLALIDVEYVGNDARLHRGQVVVHEDAADDIASVFAALATARFPIEKAIPIAAYGWDDDASMADNNTSAFNYRHIVGTERLSNHSFGLAIDINPRLNPYMRADGTVMPAGATYDPSVAGTVSGAVAELFLERGWEWGGHWTDRKDWQHFERPGDR